MNFIESLKLLFNGDIVKVSCVVCNVAHSALYNAALNKPAYQSSVYVDDLGSYNASLANDGDHETNATNDNQPRCSISKNESNPWWAVNLGRLTSVYRVDLTNRGDAEGM